MENIKSSVRSFIAFLRSSKKTVLLILIVALTCIAITTTISILLSKIYNLNLPSLGTIETIGVEAYWDPNCENKIEIIDWGAIQPGSSVDREIYLRSVTSFKTTIDFNTTNWNPANISRYINMSWNYNGMPINPGEVIQVTLTLSVDSSDSFLQYLIANYVKDFSFDIIIFPSE